MRSGSGVELSTLRRGLEILGLFLDTNRRWDTSRIAQHLGLSKSSTYKYVQTLERAGFLVRELDGRTLRLGPRILELEQSARNPFHVADLAYSILEELVAQTNESALLAGRIGNKAVCLAKVESQHSLKLSYRLGETYPLHAGGTAHVLLAWLDDASLQKILSSLTLERFTDKTIASGEELQQRLKSIRKRGFAISQGELDAGAFTVAAPVFDRNRNVIASLSIGGPLHRFDATTRATYPKLVCTAADQICDLLSRSGAGGV